LVQMHIELKTLIRLEGLGVFGPSSIDTGELTALRDRAVDAGNSGHPLLEAGDSCHTRVLANLAGQIDQRQNDTDAAEKVSEIPEI